MAATAVAAAAGSGVAAHAASLPLRHYAVTTIRGLESICRDECVAHGAVDAQVVPGAVVFRSPLTPAQLRARLRSVDAVLAYVTHASHLDLTRLAAEQALAWLSVRLVTPTPEGDALWRHALQLAFEATATDGAAVDAAAARAAQAVVKPPELTAAAGPSAAAAVSVPVFRVSAVRDGGPHKFVSEKLGASVGAALIRRFGWRVNLKTPEVDVHVHVIDTHVLCGVVVAADVAVGRYRAPPIPDWWAPVAGAGAVGAKSDDADESEAPTVAADELAAAAADGKATDAASAAAQPAQAPAAAPAPAPARRVAWKTALQPHAAYLMVAYVAGTALPDAIRRKVAALQMATTAGSAAAATPQAGGAAPVAPSWEWLSQWALPACPVLVDPMGGIGTIPLEAVAVQGPSAFAFGASDEGHGVVALSGDLNAVSVRQAACNSTVPSLPAPLRARCGFAVWDASRLPLRDGSVDAVVSDVPFGQRHGSSRQNAKLYPRLLREWARVCVPRTGVCLLLTLERKIMQRLLDTSGVGRQCWLCVDAVKLWMGFELVLFVLVRTPHPLPPLSVAKAAKHAVSAATGALAPVASSKSQLRKERARLLQQHQQQAGQQLAAAKAADSAVGAKRRHDQATGAAEAAEGSAKKAKATTEPAPVAAGTAAVAASAPVVPSASDTKTE